MLESDNGKMHPDDKRNMILFLLASLALWFVFDKYLLKPRMETVAAAQEIQEAEGNDITLPDVTGVAMPLSRPRNEVIGESKRLTIRNEVLSGSLSLLGGRLDDLSLRKYHKTVERKENVVLFSPAGTEHPQYAEFGWLSEETTKGFVPDQSTPWQVAAGPGDLTAGEPLTLFWENGQGLRFERTITLDEHYMFTVTQRVLNTGAAPVTLYPYALVTRHGLPPAENRRGAVYEGPLGYFDEELVETSYGKMRKLDKPAVQKATEGWIGITEQYWFAGLAPGDNASPKSVFRFVYTPHPDPEEDKKSKGKHQVDVTGDGRIIEPGQSVEVETYLFAGAKEMDLLGGYEKDLGIRHFDLVVDFGMFYALTKPLFYVLRFLHGLVGNFGVAIVIMTIIVRACIFPLANTSFRSFARLRTIAPLMKEVQEKHQGDKEALQKELVALYEREKVNPMAGCLPILVQMPVFFALFRVFNVAIEMRHAPFFGWIQDLSAPDPTSIFNLFGLIPWEPPAFFMIGAWPCLMLLAMLSQRRLSPPPQDEFQRMLMTYMPFSMAFIMSRFSAGLVVYWTFGNILSVLQQYIIMRSMGVEVYFFKENKADKEGDLPGEKDYGADQAEDTESGEKQGDESEEEPAEVSAPKPKKKKKK